MPRSRWLVLVALVCAAAWLAIVLFVDLSVTTICADGPSGGRCITDDSSRPWIVLFVFLGGTFTIVVGWLVFRGIRRAATAFAATTPVKRARG